MLLAGCSTVCTTVAEAAKMWNLVVVSVYPFLPSPIAFTWISYPVGIVYSRRCNEKWKDTCDLLSLALLRCIVAGAVRSKSIPDPVQDASFRHRAQPHENQIAAKVRLVSGSDIAASRRSVHIGENVENLVSHVT